MPTKKVADIEPTGGWYGKRADRPCFHREHNPPMHQVFPPGVYEHTCPACGKVQSFRVQPPWCLTTVGPVSAPWEVPDTATRRVAPRRATGLTAHLAAAA